MSFEQSPEKIRAATCTINDRSAFLQWIQEIAQEHQTHIICFNARVMAGRRHAALAVTLAFRAFEEGSNISNTPEMEALLFAAGSRQCSVAASFGVLEGENRLWICCLPDNGRCWDALGARFRFPGLEEEEIDSEKHAELMAVYAITPDELMAAGGPVRLPDLVLERVALLQVFR
jgi:KEOPS complex subunit Cgi121